MDILKTTEIDIAWGFVYAGMITSVFVVILIVYGIVKGE